MVAIDRLVVPVRGARQVGGSSSQSPLGDFLVERRKRPALRPTPEELARHPHRRRAAAGLRSVEVAARAGIDPGYYAKLEQGRASAPSAEVLEAIGHALELDGVELQHLFDLGHQVRPVRVAAQTETLPVGAAELLAHLREAPAYVTGRQWDLLAWNDAMSAVFGDPAGLPAEARNVVWMMFAIPELQTMIEDWAGHAQRVLAQFRLDWGRYRGDPRFAELVADLSARSPEFRAWWPLHHVQGRQNLQKTVTPAGYGRPITFRQSTWLLSESLNVKLVIYTPDDAEQAEHARACLQAYGEATATA